MKKYVKARSPDECRAAARAGVLYWMGSEDEEWILYEENRQIYGRNCLDFAALIDPTTGVWDDAWQEQMDMYNASILVDDDEDG